VESDIGFDRHHRPLAVVLMKAGGDSEPRSHGQLYVVQFARHNADPSNDPEHHFKVMHQFTSKARNISSGVFGPCSPKACLRALDPVKFCSVHHEPACHCGNIHEISAHTTLPSAFRYAPHSLDRCSTSISPRPDSIRSGFLTYEHLPIAIPDTDQNAIQIGGEPQPDNRSG
jgi:hypothetical protein